MSCLHLLSPFDLAYRKTFVITVIREDKEMNDHSLDFLYYFLLQNIYIFNLSECLSFCQFVDGKFLAHCKNQALIANYSMIG